MAEILLCSLCVCVCSMTVGLMLGYAAGRKATSDGDQEKRGVSTETTREQQPERALSEKEKRALRELQLFLQYDGFPPKSEEQTEE